MSCASSGLLSNPIQADQGCQYLHPEGFYMRAQLSLAVFALLAVCSGTFATAQAPQGNVVRLPGLTYEVLRSGPPAGVRPLRSDDVMIRYVGRLEDGSIFSTSAADGMGPTRFSVRTVIPGFSALVQLMRPGDRWRFTIPGYLGYGHEGRRYLDEPSRLV
jgi:FKBP-type peptidyl-prolyl cis-trans isomerase